MKEDRGQENNNSKKKKEMSIQELQMLEQNLQNIFLQKQAFQIEMRETQAALKELEKSGEEVFKIIGQLMIKTDKKEMKEELVNKEKILDLRIRSFEKQEHTLSEKLSELQTEILK
ncbi:MAG: prefoldin subunit beta [Nanoarchaeota archaeon]